MRGRRAVSSAIASTRGWLRTLVIMATQPLDLSSLRGHQVSDVSWSDPLPWAFSFSDGTRITVECPWRILRDAKILLSSEDHRQKYGLPAPIDAVADARKLLDGKPVREFAVHPGTSDILVAFTDGLSLQILTFATGYECWQLERPGSPPIVAMPGA